MGPNFKKKYCTHPLLLSLELSVKMALIAQVLLATALASQVCAQGSWVVSFDDDFLGNQLNSSAWTASNYSSVVSQYDGHDALFTADMVSFHD